MKPDELFNHIWRIDYNKSGFDLDWKVEVDDNEKEVRLLFQPSMSNKDWFINIAGFIPVFKFPLFYCWGWKTVFDCCKDLIMQEFLLEVTLHKDYRAVIAGHSYGGAQSIIAAIEVFKKSGIRAEVITFGAPCPLFLLWSKLVSKLYLGNVTQYAHRSDIVTYCPPLIGYHNVRVKRIGKFNIKNLFNPNVYHMIYGNADLYK